MIHKVELKDSAGFENSPGKAHIGLGRGRIAARVVVHHDERISGMRDHRVEHFSWVGEGLIDRPLTNRADLDEMLLGVEKNNPKQLTIEKRISEQRSAIASGLSMVSA